MDFNLKLIADTLIQLPKIPALIADKAAKYSLDPEIVAAVVLQESGGNTWAHRYEPGFYRRYLERLKRKDLTGHVPSEIPTLNTEKVDRAISWGLMQCLGETARMMDFAEDDLTMLVVPEINIEIGCKYLRHLLDRDAYKTIEAHRLETKFFKSFLTGDILHMQEVAVRYMMCLLRYNGGGNVKYPAEIMERVINGSAKKLLNKRE
jgi:hypothetical protein